ncbi:MAG: flagellar hook capping FlgD N-terminal domain-containing protein [Campylobacterota bacterium]|nr:flagellar hook capping FlgD N-terminal domain-containing protein [Campylobacterota bacterium]
MAVDNVQVSSTVGADGNTYTSAIANDQLTNDDFLKLLLTEMQMQDPTKPMDSQKMMDSQLQMSTIEANLQMAASMESLQASFAQSNLATSAAMIDHVIENGEYGEDGAPKQFVVTSVESQEGELYLLSHQITGYDEEDGQLILSTEQSAINFNNVNKIY